MNDNFEQQFAKNVQQAVATQPPIKPTSDSNVSSHAASSKIPWIIIAGLSFVILLQVIALIIVLTNFAPETSIESDADTEEDSVIYNDPNYKYDDNGNLIAFNLTCSNNGANLAFSINNQYTSPNNSGTYSITNNNIISLDDNPNHILYYDGFSIIDGTTIYNCEDSTTENTENAE